MNTRTTNGSANALAELFDALRVEQARGCPEQRPTPAGPSQAVTARLWSELDSPAVCAERRRLLQAAVAAADPYPHLRLVGDRPDTLQEIA